MNKDFDDVSPDAAKRRAKQIAAAKWLTKYMYPMQLYSALIGFFIVLLPLFSRPWRGIVEAFPLTAWIFRDFSGLKGWAMVLFGLLMLGHMILNWKVKDYPGGWNPTKEWGFPTPQQVVEKELYPRNEKEVFVFWVDVVYRTMLNATIWLLIFGIVAFFIKIK